MTVRTTETTVTFKHPFMIGALDSPQPAGTYRLVVEEEAIPDLTFLAYRRTATMLHVPAVAVASPTEQVFFVDAAELAAALAADQQAGTTAPAEGQAESSKIRDVTNASSGA
jgi:hypothetical protein